LDGYRDIARKYEAALIQLCKPGRIQRINTTSVLHTKNVWNGSISNSNEAI